MRSEFFLNEEFDVNKQQTHRLSKSVGMIEKTMKTLNVGLKTMDGLNEAVWRVERISRRP